MAAPIVTRLVLNTASFKAAASGASSALKPLGAGLAKIAGLASTATLAFTGLSAAFAAIVVRQTAFIARLNDTAQKLGVNVQFLQKFRFAAEQSGVSIETADMALQRFTRRVAEAAQGTGEARGALAQLGIQIRDTNGGLRPMEDILFDVADGIANTTSEAERVRLAFKFFDSEGVALVNTLQGGSDALKEMFGEAAALGFVLSADSAQGVKDFDDALTNLKVLLTGVINQLTAALAPALEEVTEAFIEFVKQFADGKGGFEGLGKAIKDNIIDIVVMTIKVIEAMINAFVKVGNTVYDLGVKFGVFKDELGPLKEAIDAIQSMGTGPTVRLGPFIADLLKFKTVSQDAADILEEVFGGAGVLIDADERAKAIEVLTKRLKEAGGAAGFMSEVDLSNLVEMLTKYKEASIAANQEIAREHDGELVFTYQKQTSLWQALLDKIYGRDRMTSFWQAYDAEGATVLERLGAIAKLVLGDDLIMRLKEGLQNAGVGDYIRTLSEGFVSAVQKFEDSLADAIVTGKADFSDLADHIKKVLAKALVQKFITGPLLAAFGLPGRAAGGPVSAGSAYIVGEKGPELFVPTSSGNIIPNDQMSNGMGSGVGQTNVTYNIQAVDAASFKQLVARDPEFIYSVTQAGARRLPA